MNIQDYKDGYWVEAGGRVEELLDRYNGCPIPSTHAKDLLKTNDVEEIGPDFDRFYDCPNANAEYQYIIDKKVGDLGDAKQICCTFVPCLYARRKTGLAPSA